MWTVWLGHEHSFPNKKEKFGDALNRLVYMLCSLQRSIKNRTGSRKNLNILQLFLMQTDFAFLIKE